jgi:hypothetical protein
MLLDSQKERRKRVEAKKSFKNNGRKIPKFGKIHKLTYSKPEQTPHNFKPKKFIPSYNLIKFMKTKAKEKSLVRLGCSSRNRVLA